MHTPGGDDSKRGRHKAARHGHDVSPEVAGGRAASLVRRRRDVPTLLLKLDVDSEGHARLSRICSGSLDRNDSDTRGG